MTFDEKLKQALSEDYEERMSRRAAKEKEHKFSLAYRLWERKFLKDLRKGRCESTWTLKKARKYVTAAVIACLAFVLMGCMVVGTAIGRYSFNDKKTYSELFLENHPSDKTRFEEYYGLPEEDGWEIIDFGELTQEVMISYKRGSERVIFGQNIICNNMGVVNTENAVVEPMSIYEEKDGFFIEFQNGEGGLWWIYDGYLLEIIGNLDKNELVNLAHSTKNVDF